MAKERRKIDTSPLPLPSHKRVRTTSLDIHEDKQNSSSSHQTSSRHSSRSTHSANKELISHILAELTELRQQREQDRVHLVQVQTILDAQNDHIKVLQEGYDQKQSAPSHSERHFSVSIDNERIDRNSAKNEVRDSESEGTPEAPNIYDASPQPPLGPRGSRHISSVPQDSPFQEDPSLAPLTQKTITLYEGMRMPSVIECLEPLQNVRLPVNPNEAFSFAFLKSIFGGKPITKTCYGIPPASRRGRMFPELSAWKFIKPDHDPLLPRVPGQHGAQLSCIYAERGIQINTFPVFIHRVGAGYQYFGHYREPRDSDLVSGSEMSQVPLHIKEYWSEQLGAKNSKGTKTRQALDALIGQWPQKPLGWFKKGSRTLLEYKPELVQKHGEAVQRPITDDEAKEIGTQSILDAFDRADFDEHGSISLWYEYLECVAYDNDFYQKLVSKKLEEEESDSKSEQE